jgi:hypothetical protein
MAMMMQPNFAHNNVINQTNAQLRCSPTCLAIIALYANYGNRELLLHAWFSLECAVLEKRYSLEPKPIHCLG